MGWIYLLLGGVFEIGWPLGNWRRQPDTVFYF